MQKKNRQVLSILLTLFMVIALLPSTGFALAEGGVSVTNLTVEQPPASTPPDCTHLTVSWDAMADADYYSITYDNKVGGVSNPQTATTAGINYTLSGLSECQWYDISVLPHITNGVTVSAIGVTRSSKTAFTFVPTAAFSGSTTPSRYYSYPAATQTTSGTFVNKYDIGTVEKGANSVFRWYLQAGFNGTNARDHVNSFRLFNVTDNQEIDLNYGTTNFGSGTTLWPTVTGVTDGTFAVTNMATSGDFEVAKMSAGGTWIRFEAKIDKYLVPGKTYVIAVGPYFHTGGQNPTRLNKIYEYQFTVKDEAKWPDDASLSVSNVGVNTATLNWPAVVDPSLISKYVLYVNGVEEDSDIPNTQTYYDMEGLTASTKYTFQVKAYTTDGKYIDGPSSTIVTQGSSVLTFTADPAVTAGSETEYTKDYTFDSPVDPANFYLSWNFTKGIDANLAANLAGIHVYDVETGNEVALDKGTPPYGTGTDGVITAGDFKYTKIGGGTGTGGDARLLSFEPTAATLAKFDEGKQYKLEMQPDFINNNGEYTLGKITTFYFTIASDDPIAPTWTSGSSITTGTVGPDSMVINWPQATDNTRVTGYQIVVNSGSAIKVPASTTSYQLTNLTKSTAYNIAVYAVDAKSNKSDPLTLTQSTIEADVTAPTWLSGKTLTVRNVAPDNLDLQWTDAADELSLAGYKIYQDGVHIGTVDSATKTLHVSGLTPNTSYTFKVEAYDTAGNLSTDGPSKVISTLDGTPDSQAPTWPSGYSYSLSQTGTVKLSYNTLQWPWAEDNVAVAGYEVYRGDTYLGTVDDTANSYTDTIARDNLYYTYKIYAFDLSGNRSVPIVFSGVWTGDPNMDVTSPTWPAGSNITLSDFGIHTVLVNWSAANDNVGVTNYLVKNGQAWVEGIFQGDETPGRYSFNDRKFWYAPANIDGYNSSLDTFELRDGQQTTLSIKAFDGPQNSTMNDPKITFYPGTNPTAGSGIPFALTNVANTRGTLNNLTGAVNNITSPTDPVNTVLKFVFDKKIKPDYANNISLTDLQTGANIDLTGKLNYTEPTTTQGCITLNITGAGILQQDKTYRITIGKNLSAADSTMVGFPIAWDFTTAVNDKEAPVWATGSALTAEFKVAPDVATLTWPAASDNVGVTKYIIKNNSTTVKTVAGDILTCKVEGLATATSCAFSVVAADYLGNESSELTQTVTTPDVNSSKPAFSGAMSFTDISSDHLTVNWPAASSPYDIKEYLVKRDGVQIATVSGITLNCKAEGLTGETSYNFSVVAKDYSNNLSDPFTGSQTTAVDTILPVWTSSSAINSKNIESSQLALYWTPATDNVSVDKYLIYQDGVKIKEVAGTTSQCAITGLTPSTKYIFAVEAQDAKQNTTATRLTLVQSTAAASPSEGAGFGFDLVNVANENSSVGTTTVTNQVTVNMLASTAKLIFNFDKELQTDAWLNNVELVKITASNTLIPLPPTAFNYTTSGGINALDITIPAELLASGEYQLKLKSGLTAADSTALGKDYIWKFNVASGTYSVIDVASGSNSYSAVNGPSDRYNLIVKSDGTVWGWGNNDYGHLGDGTTQRATEPTKALGLENIIKVYTGRDSSFALDKDGNLYGWGSNELGQLGRGVLPTGTSGRYGNNTPVKINGLPKIVDMAYGFQRVVALDVNGDVWTWGFRTSSYLAPYGILSTGTPEKVAHLSNIVDVSVGWNYSLAVTADGDVYRWYGKDDTPVKIDGLNEIKAVSASANNYGYHDLALRKDGTVWMWGYKTVVAPLGEDNTRDMAVTKVAGAENIKDIYADNLTMLTADRKIQQINANIDDANSTAAAGDVLSGFDNISKLTSYASGGLFLQTDGTLKTFTATTAAVNVPDLSVKSAPVWAAEKQIKIKNKTENGLTVTWDSCGDDIAAYALYKNGDLVSTLSGSTLSYDFTGLTKNTSYQFKVEARYASSAFSTNGPSITISTLADWNPTMTGLGKVAAGTGHTLMVDESGAVWAWGDNTCGQLGNGTTESSKIPVKVNGLINITGVAVGDKHSVALDSDGNIWVWGDNSKYQLGTGNTASSSTPIMLTPSAISNVKQISAAGNYTLAVKTDGTLWSWGEACNANLNYLTSGITGHVPGKMKYGTYTSATIDYSNVKMAAASRNFHAVLFSDGTISRSGSFVDNVGAPTYWPPLFNPGLMGVQAISAGDSFLMALLEDGTVAVMGDNSQGQYGIGNRTNPTPAAPCNYAKVSGLTSISAISAGGSFGLALKSDGTVWGWGQNNNGQLGINNTITQTVPVKMSFVSGTEAIDGGSQYSVAVISDSTDAVTAYSSGTNDLGQLGNGTNDVSYAPKGVLFAGASDTISPSFPASFSMNAYKQDATSAAIMWSDAADNFGVVSYKVFKNNVEVATVTDGSNEYVATGLASGSAVTFCIKAVDAKGNESDFSKSVTFDIATLGAAPALSEPFAAKVINLANGAKDVAIDTKLDIAFETAIKLNADITNGSAIKLTCGDTPVSTAYSLSSDGKKITVTPTSPLSYGKDYKLEITSKVKNLLETLCAAPASVIFSTQSFKDASVTSAVNGNGLDLNVNLNNMSGSSKDVVVKYVVRRDKGARLEDGGTVAVVGQQTATIATGNRSVGISIPDVTKDSFGNSLNGSIYADIYIINTSGVLLFEPIHVKIQ